MRRTLALAPAFAASGVLFGILAIPYLRMLREFAYERPLLEGLDLLEYLRPPPGSLWAQLVAMDIEPSIAPQFLGFATLALAAVGLTWRRPEGRGTRLVFALIAATGLLGLVLSLGPTIRIGGEALATGPYRWLYDGVPLFRVFRSAERMSLLVRLGVAVLAGFGARALFEGLTERRLRLARIALIVILPYEHFTGGQPFTTIPTGAAAPPVYEWLALDAGDGPRRRASALSATAAATPLALHLLLDPPLAAHRVRPHVVLPPAGPATSPGS